MFGLFRKNDKNTVQTELNLILSDEINKLRQRMKILEADLAVRKTKELEADKAERQRVYHGIG